MKEAPKDKMIRTEDETNKSSGVRSPRLKKWYFPKEKKTVAAATYEEALHIINNLKK